MKFAHLADCHIGSYRDERMKALVMDSFVWTIDRIIEEGVDFVLISGDLFNTSLPAIDALKIATTKLKDLSNLGIPVYIIAGSHDFSPSGKTMLDVLENAGLCINVVKGNVDESGNLKLDFTVDKATGVKITGMIGKKGMLEKSYYESLNVENLESEPGFKIFMFHTAITELKKKGMEKMDSAPMSYLPKGFNYYAGGHVHDPLQISSDDLGGVITYPGPLFPNSFKEIKDLGQGGFYIFDMADPELLKFVPVKIKERVLFDFNLDKKSPEESLGDISTLKEKDVSDKLVLIRLHGKLSSGKPSDINLKEIFTDLYSRGAYFVMRNTSGLTSEAFEEIALKTESIFEIEDNLIKEHIGQMKFDKLEWDVESEKKTVRHLLEMLDVEKVEGETQTDFEDRIKENLDFLKVN